MVTLFKVRDCVPVTKSCTDAQQLQTLEGIIECEKPNTDLYEYVGVIKLANNGNVSKL